MSEYFKGLYIAQLSDQRQSAIEQELYCIGLEQNEIEHFMNNRISDLLSMIDVSNLLQIN